MLRSMKPRHIATAAAAAAAAGFATFGLFPGIASAHTPGASAQCKGVTANGSSYNAGDSNSYVITLDGLSKSGTFDTGFSAHLDNPGGNYTWAVVITTSADPDGSKGWTKAYRGSTDSCKAPATTTTTTTAPTESTTTTGAPEITTTTGAPQTTTPETPVPETTIAETTPTVESEAPAATVATDVPPVPAVRCDPPSVLTQGDVGVYCLTTPPRPIPAAPAGTAAPVAAPAAGSSPAELPHTGTNTVEIAIIAGMSLVVGAGSLLAARRKTR